MKNEHVFTKNIRFTIHQSYLDNLMQFSGDQLKSDIIGKMINNITLQFRHTSTFGNLTLIEGKRILTQHKLMESFRNF
jgi:hypothetical protein